MPAKFFKLHTDLQTTLERILEETWEAFPQLAQNQVAATWIVYGPPCQVNTGGAIAADTFWKYRPPGASYRGVELIEPDALVQLFYLVAMHVWLEQGMAQLSPEIARALADMTTEGAHDATSFIVDVLSGTTSGPAIPAGPFETWQSQRNIVNRYFQQLGWPELRAINLNQKTWNEGPYGREREFFGKAFDNRNQLTTEATARLLHSIIGGVSVSGPRSQAMMKLLQKPAIHSPTETDQTTSLIASSLPSTISLWSKASIVKGKRHETAYVEADSAEGAYPYQLTIFTDTAHGTKKTAKNSDTSGVIPFISERIFQASQQLLKADALA
ncbi:MAG: serine hydrolase [Cyanobacteria bacterium J06598_3]